MTLGGSYNIRQYSGSGGFGRSKGAFLKAERLPCPRVNETDRVREVGRFDFVTAGQITGKGNVARY